MRLLLVTAGFLPDGLGGVELSMARFAKWAMSEGHEILVFRRVHLPDEDEFLLQESEVEGIRVVGLNYRFGDAQDFMALLRNPRIRERYESVLADYRPDVVHVHHLTCLTTEIVDSSREAGVPVVLSLHDYWMGCPRGQRIMADLSHCPRIDAERCTRCYRETWTHWFSGPRDAVAEQRLFDEYHGRIREVLDRASALVVASPFARGVFAREGVPEGRMEVLEYGMDLAAFQGLERRPSSTFRIGFLGTILPSKGVHLLIEAFKSVASTEPDLSLSLHGAVLPFHQDHGYGERLKEQVRGFESQIQFHGAYQPSEVPGLLGELDLLVVPSIWYETYCMVIREGFLAGVPVLASNFGAMAEAIEHAKTGMLFEVGDAQDLAQKIGLVLRDQGLQQRLAEAPKHVVGVEENGRRTFKIYERLTHGG